MLNFHVWRHVPGKALLFLVNIVASTALIFEGQIATKPVEMEPTDIA
jgi:hypothetical protein